VVDVPRFGRDKTVFNFGDGLESYRRETYQGIGMDKPVQLIKDFAAVEKIPYSHILVHEDGIGGGVVDQLTSIKGFTAKSPIPTKSMLRGQMLLSVNLTLEGKRLWLTSKTSRLSAHSSWQSLGDAPYRRQYGQRPGRDYGRASSDQAEGHR
jgi:hypothetical protein